jgi:hypothetical protein
MGPSKGQWVTVEMYPRTNIPFRFAPDSTGLNRSMDSSTVQLILRRVKASDVAVKTAIFFSPARIARSNPLSFGTNPE